MYKQADLLESLRSIPWFMDLKPQNFEQLVNISNLIMLDAGEMVFTEGERATTLYVILDGQVEIISHVPGHGPVTIFKAEPLDVIGWSSMTPFVRQRTSSAKAATSVRMISLDGDTLRRLCDQDHDMGYLIMRRISNVIASRLLTTRLQLYDIIVNKDNSGL